MSFNKSSLTNATVQHLETEIERFERFFKESKSAEDGLQRNVTETERKKNEIDAIVKDIETQQRQLGERLRIEAKRLRDAEERLNVVNREYRENSHKQAEYRQKLSDLERRRDSEIAFLTKSTKRT